MKARLIVHPTFSIIAFTVMLPLTEMIAEDSVIPAEDFVKVFSVPEEEVNRLITIQGPPKVAINVSFESASSEIMGTQNVTQLDQLGKALASTELSGRVFSIEGHTDNRGDAEYNLKLSQRRSQAVADYLVSKHGVKPEQIQVNGQGEYFLLDNSDTDEAHAKNRRVEIVLNGRVE